MTDEEKINEVLEEFDFEKVHEVMNFLKWKWADNNDTMSIPSHYRIIEEAKRLLYYCKKEKDDITISTGGFIAQKDKDENGESYYSLSFVICESSNL